jgi:hypothetical protein
MIFEPYKVISSDDPRLVNLIDQSGDHYWVLVEVNTNDEIVNVLGWDGGAPEDQILVRDFDWVPEVLNQQYNNHKLELDKLEKQHQDYINQLIIEHNDSFEKMERSLYLKLQEKENIIDDFLED